MTGPQIPPNFFGIPSSLAALGETWTLAARVGRAPAAPGEIILSAAAVVRAVVAAACLWHLGSDHKVLRQDLLDPLAAPFVSLSLVTLTWIYGSPNVDSVHPGYLLPTVAGGLVGSAAAASVGQQRRLLGECFPGALLF